MGSKFSKRGKRGLCVHSLLSFSSTLLLCSLAISIDTIYCRALDGFAQQLCSVVLNALTVFAMTTLRVNLTVNKSSLRGKEDKNISY